jgi:hypothetical protein
MADNKLKGLKLMKLASVFLIALVAWGSSNAYAENNTKAPSNIELKNSSDVQDAMKLQKAYEPLFNKFAECFEKKLAQSSAECYCLYPTEASQAKSAYEATLAKHPAWRDQGIFWSADKKSYQLSFFGLRHRFEQTCPTHPSGEAH